MRRCPRAATSVEADGSGSPAARRTSPARVHQRRSPRSDGSVGAATTAPWRAASASRRSASWRLAVAQDEADLLGRQRRIDRHRDGAGRENREVDEQPLRPALREEHHAIAARHAERAQPQAEIADALEELARRSSARTPSRSQRPSRSGFGNRPLAKNGSSRSSAAAPDLASGSVPAVLSTTFSSGSPRRKRATFSRNRSTTGAQ